MSLQPPNIQIPIVDSQQRMTPQFLKFLGDLSKHSPGSVSGRVDTLETDVSALQATVTSLVGSLAALTTTVAGHTTHLNLLPTSRLSGSAVYDPPNLIALATTTTTVTVTGAALGMAAEASFSLDLTGLVMTAYVSSANTVTVVLVNPTAGAINIGSGTLTTFVWNP